MNDAEELQQSAKDWWQATRRLLRAGWDWSWQAAGRLFGKQCVLCQKRKRDGKDLRVVSRWNSYYSKKFLYHEDCLNDVVQDPETHGHRKVDLALDIMDCLDHRAKREQQRAGARAMKLQKIKAVRDREADDQEERA